MEIKEKKSGKWYNHTCTASPPNKDDSKACAGQTCLSSLWAKQLKKVWKSYKPVFWEEGEGGLEVRGVDPHSEKTPSTALMHLRTKVCKPDDALLLVGWEKHIPKT